MLNIIKRLDKIIDDLNCMDIEHIKNVDIFEMTKELSEIQKQLSKPIEIYRNNRWIYDVQPNNPSWTIIESDETNTKPCDTE
jgi:argonaute-like protein implicated in RNA metabolism and viral defense